MRTRWTRTATVTGLAAVALLGTAVALGPHQLPDTVTSARTAAAPVSAAGALDGYVGRTTAHLARVPGDWQAWAQLGMAHLELARTRSDPAQLASAEVALRRSLTVRPTGNAAALTGLGALAAAEHDFGAALSFARRAVATDKYSADAYGVLTDAYVELGRYAEATDAVQRMLQLRPDTGSYARASYLFELHGNVPRATELMRRALAVAAQPGDRVFALTHLGELAFDNGDLDTAAARFAEGLAHQPEDPALLANRGRVAAARGDLTAAIADLRASTSAVPAVDRLGALADAQTAAGDPAGAARTDDVVRVGGRLAGSTATDIDLVIFQADRGEAGTAASLGRDLFARRPSIAVEMAYAWALHAAGRHREARAHADHALRLGTRDATSHYYRGMIRLALGDRPGARADLATAIRINPHFSLRYAPRARVELAGLDGAR